MNTYANVFSYYLHTIVLGKFEYDSEGSNDENFD